jgi:hypothetical protein
VDVMVMAANMHGRADEVSIVPSLLRCVSPEMAQAV